MINKFLQLFRNANCHLLISPLLLSLVGIIVQSGITLNNGTFPSGEVLIQAIALICGVISAFAVLYLGYGYITSLEKFLYIFGIILLLLVYIPGIGISSYGSRAWISLGFTSFQPSEIAKIIFIITMAMRLAAHGPSLQSPRGILFAALYGMPYILIVTKEDFGTGCIFCAIWIFMVFCSGLELRIIGRLTLCLLITAPLIYFFLAGYQKDRIDAFLNPSDLSLPGNYQVWNSKVAIGSGGLLGKGFAGGSQSTLGFLPVPQSDFIFAAAVEKLGLLGGLAIIILFAYFLYISMKHTKYAKDLQGTLIGAGLVGMFFFQSFENIAMTMGLMPVTGIPLPFMSSGGSSMLSSMTGVGLLLSISCRQKV